ncbi:MAG: type II toxin-antitoxin system RelE/ParE family toxin [Synergistaceae bacterium]|nr:type II toxin-antitoxin system RelE/ParE family toxin [Synergistaceae bacterium]
MQSYRVNVLPSAFDDVLQIQQYIFDSSNNFEAALRQRKRLLSAIDKLSVSLKIYRVRKKDAFNREIRYLPVDSYNIVFTVYDDEKIVDVINVIHEKRDIDSLI